MSIKVKEFLALHNILTTHEERVELDKEIEKKTKKFCDEGIKDLSYNDVIEMLNNIRKKKKKVVELVME